MSGLNKDTRTLLVGALIGVAGVSAISLLLASRHGKNKGSFNFIGQALHHVGEILDNHDIKEPSVMKNVEKTLEKNEGTVGDVIDWVATGIQLWRKIKD